METPRQSSFPSRNESHLNYPPLPTPEPVFFSGLLCPEMHRERCKREASGPLVSKIYVVRLPTIRGAVHRKATSDT